jgi:hypothetical protein
MAPARPVSKVLFSTKTTLAASVLDQTSPGSRIATLASAIKTPGTILESAMSAVPIPK